MFQVSWYGLHQVLKLRDIFKGDLLRTLTFPFLRLSFSYHRIPHTHLLHPFPHFTHPHLTLLDAILLVIGYPNDPAAISFSNNGMSLVPVPARIPGAQESFDKLIGGYLTSCSPFVFNMELLKSRGENVKINTKLSTPTSVSRSHFRASCRCETKMPPEICICRVCEVTAGRSGTSLRNPCM